MFFLVTDVLGLYDQTLLGLKISWINNWLKANNINGSGSISGAYYQV